MTTESVLQPAPEPLLHPVSTCSPMSPPSSVYSIALPLSVIGAVLLSAVLLTAVVRRKRKPAAAEPCTPLAPQPLYCFGGEENARAVHDFANVEFYQHLLAAMEVALLREGYELTRQPTRQVCLTTDVRKRVARHVVLEKELYIAPGQKLSEVNQRIRMNEEEGYNERWLALLINGSAGQGWYIGRREGWEGIAYPLRQVQITVRIKPPVDIRQVVQCFEMLGRTLRNEPFPDMFIGEHQSEIVDLHFDYQFYRALCDVPPGWFPGVAGLEVPVGMTAGRCSPASSSAYRHYIVRAQGTRQSTPDQLADYVGQAVKRIADGESRGAKYDDDSGYAFTVTMPATET